MSDSIGTRPLPRSFFARPADEVAPALLGVVLKRTLDDGRVLAGRIVEAEAYLGPEDRASHAFNGRRTPRNEMMYARPGTCYVYLTYGVHFMCNVACLREGHPAAVLIRALEPLHGIDAMRVHRPSAEAERDLCSGPGKLCQALAINAALNGVDLLQGLPLRLVQGPDAPRTDHQSGAARVGRSARIGVDSCGSWAASPLRWFLAENPHVSPGRPSGGKRSRVSRGPSGSNRSGAGSERKLH